MSDTEGWWNKWDELFVVNSQKKRWLGENNFPYQKKLFDHPFKLLRQTMCEIPGVNEASYSRGVDDKTIPLALDVIIRGLLSDVETIKLPTTINCLAPQNRPIV